ncbi:hypothetical protein DPM35_30045 [Mesorhizobium atlanticum]|uniref:Uncharacterized protein n=1 Tax=Mesorhizobium atlanticum TaxID=2233532 RepID=A0A330GGQ8_9HYPH|nr:hypothetical protein DPM35_30045 [Mesorhizobium atlanticum]
MVLPTSLPYFGLYASRSEERNGDHAMTASVFVGEQSFHIANKVSGCGEIPSQTTPCQDDLHCFLITGLPRSDFHGLL